MLDFGSPKEVLALSMDPPNLENMCSTVMLLKEIGALLITANGEETEVSENRDYQSNCWPLSIPFPLFLALKGLTDTSKCNH